MNERKMMYTDNLIREGLRINPILTQVAMREVKPKDGITLPSGEQLPQGT